MWNAETVDATVTRQFVCKNLWPEEIARLDQPLDFGDGLTDDTYWGWISEKAKRIFLILVDIKVPEQIFGLIDCSWDDSDLPIDRDEVARLALTRVPDERIEQQFYKRQFHYIQRPLQKGEHALYQPDEIVPVEVRDGRHQGTSHAQSRVVLPNEPGMMFCCRHVPLGPGPVCLDEEIFQHEVDNIRNVHHEHLRSYWASYVHLGVGYVLFTPVSDFSLKTLLHMPPAAVKNMDKQARRKLVTNWIHCLADALCFVHSRGLSHKNIKPSAILFTEDNRVFFSDFTRFNPELPENRSGKASSPFDKESYDYAAPEQWFRPPATGPSHRRHTSAPSWPTGSTGSPENLNFSISRGGADHSSQNPVALVMHAQAQVPAPTPHLDPQAADIFSLGCVILELLSFLVKKQGKPFAVHRAAKHKSPGRGGALPDSSFHKNLGQVESWMSQLAAEATAKSRSKLGRFGRRASDGDGEGGDGEGSSSGSGEVAGMVPLLHVVERMLAYDPAERPPAAEVQALLYRVLTESCGIAEPHCVHQYHDPRGRDFGIGGPVLNPNPLPPPPPPPPPAQLLQRDNFEVASAASTKASSSGSGSGFGSGSSLRFADYYRRTGSSSGSSSQRTGSSGIGMSSSNPNQDIATTATAAGDDGGSVDDDDDDPFEELVRSKREKRRRS